MLWSMKSNQTTGISVESIVRESLSNVFRNICQVRERDTEQKYFLCTWLKQKTPNKKNSFPLVCQMKPQSPVLFLHLAKYYGISIFKTGSFFLRLANQTRTSWSQNHKHKLRRDTDTDTVEAPASNTRKNTDASKKTAKLSSRSRNGQVQTIPSIPLRRRVNWPRPFFLCHTGWDRQTDPGLMLW